MIFSPVDHAADVTVQGDVVEVEVSGLDFTGVLLGPVALKKKSTVTTYMYSISPESCKNFRGG